MTEAEIIASWTSLTEISATATAIYLSLVSGYLVVAYVAGKNLEKLQLIVVNTLFVIAAEWHAFASAMHGSLGAEMASRLDPSQGDTAPAIMFWGWFTLLSCGVVACIYFMHKTRQLDDGGAT